MSLLAAYADAWADGRADAIAAHWSPEDFRFYKAEEIAAPFASWNATLGYWRANEAMHDQVLLSFGDESAMPLADGWSLLLTLMRWDIRFAADAPAAVAGKAMGGDNHVLALLRGDKLAGWCEAPDAPLSYMRRLYEQSARL